MVLDPYRWATGLDPFRELRRIQAEMGRLLEDYPTTGAAQYPPLNVWADRTGAIVTALLPGVDGDDIDVSVKEDLDHQGNAQTCR